MWKYFVARELYANIRGNNKSYEGRLLEKWAKSKHPGSESSPQNLRGSFKAWGGKISGSVRQNSPEWSVTEAGATRAVMGARVCSRDSWSREKTRLENSQPCQLLSILLRHSGPTASTWLPLGKVQEWKDSNKIRAFWKAEHIASTSLPKSQGILDSPAPSRPAFRAAGKAKGGDSWGQGGSWMIRLHQTWINLTCWIERKRSLFLATRHLIHWFNLNIAFLHSKHSIVLLSGVLLKYIGSLLCARSHARIWGMRRSNSWPQPSKEPRGWAQCHRMSPVTVLKHRWVQGPEDWHRSLSGGTFQMPPEGGGRYAELRYPKDVGRPSCGKEIRPAEHHV